jgi:nucleotide-binding universal stress UspA family protein
MVAVNGGPESEAALAWAVERARQRPVVLDVITVVPLAPRAADADAFLLPAYEQVLTDAVQRAERDAPGTVVTGFVRRGDARSELLYASTRADLLVVGAHEPAGVFHGILPHQVAAAASCPVVVAPAGRAPRGGSFVVVGVDEDDTAMAALDRAAVEADRLGHRLVLVHAWRIPAALLPGLVGLRPDPYTTVRTTHERILERCAETVRSAHPGVELRTMLREGPAAVEIVEVAASADLLVVGTHRRGTIPGLLIGSVAHDVLIAMPCPVMVVPHPDDAPLHQRVAAGQDGASPRVQRDLRP